METAPADRRYRSWIIGATVVGGVWRIALLISKWHVPLLLNDSFFYSAQAWQNAHGDWFQQVFGVSGAEHAPLTSLVLTPASLIPNHEFWQRATMTVLGIATIPLLAYVARKVGGRRVGVIAAVIAAVYPNLWINDSLIMSETLSTLLVTVAILTALIHRERFTVASAVVCGLAIGVAGLARSELLMLVVLFGVIGVRSKPFALWVGRAALIAATALVVIAPWVLYNSSRYDGFVLMSTNDGTTFLGANCPEVYSGPAMGGWSLDCVVRAQDQQPDEDPARRSSRLRTEAINYAREHSDRVPLVVAARLLRAVDLYGLDNLIASDVGEERARWAVWAGIVSWWILAPLAVVGWWRTRRTTGPIIAAPVVGVLVTTVVFYGAHRLRAPLEPSVVIGAAITVAWLLARRRTSPAAAPPPSSPADADPRTSPASLHSQTDAVSAADGS